MTTTFGKEVVSAPLSTFGVGCLSMGAAIGSGRTEQWWWTADVLVAVGIALLIVGVMSIARRRKQSNEIITNLSVSRHIAVSFATGVPVITGVLLVGSSAATSAFIVAPLLLWAGYASKQRLTILAPVTSSVLAVIAGALTFASSPDPQQGFATLVQACVVALIVVSVLVPIVALIGCSVTGRN